MSTAAAENSHVERDILGWDVVNWSQALTFWEDKLGDRFAGLRALELGAGSADNRIAVDWGGLSLWLARKGCEVVCSAYGTIAEGIKATHEKYGVMNRITYADIDARAMAREEAFDIICYKSVLGGIVGAGSLEIARTVVAEIWKALRPGGALLFAENLVGTRLHDAVRRRFGASSRGWRYFTIEEIRELHAEFSHFDYTTFGLTGCFGRSEKQRRLLGTADRTFCDKLTPESWRYVVAGIATK